MLSTCNRTEFYLAGEKAEQAAAELRRKLAESHGADSDPHWYEHHRISAARHLCRVVSGLDSMVLGETEIFGQAKEAYRQALESGATSATLNKLFQRAFAVGKKVRTDTRIQEGATSVAGAAVELAEKIFAAGRDLSEPDNVLIAAAACEMHPAAVVKGVSLESTRRSLAEARERAAADGITEVPSIWIDGQVLSGERAIPA